VNIDLAKIRDLKGLVATVSITGDVKPQFSHSLSNLRDFNSRNDLTNIEYRYFEAKLVEAGRDAVAKHALKEGYDFFLMIDADAGPFPDTALVKLLWNTFVTHPFFDVMGVYAQLKQAPYLPVIDTGTGTWEPWMPGAGILEVIRTGGHFLLVKTPILRRFGPPWFRTRIPYSPAKAFRELDNFARCKLDGKNPLQSHPEWETLLAQAKAESTPESSESVHIGEDSGFCDAVKAAGGRIGVDTDIIAGHIGTKVIKPEDLWDEIVKDTKKQYRAVGVNDYE